VALDVERIADHRRSDFPRWRALALDGRTGGRACERDRQLRAALSALAARPTR
jgi:hypothetical protein